MRFLTGTGLSGEAYKTVSPRPVRIAQVFLPRHVTTPV